MSHSAILLAVLAAPWFAAPCEAGKIPASQPAAASRISVPAPRNTTARLDPDPIDAYAKGQLAEKGYPSLSFGVVLDQELIFQKAYGLADRQTNRPASPETIYRIGSITKVFTTTLTCVLRDQGRLQLDDPISKYLPADVRLPSDPRGAAGITFRHLATHTSGLPRMPANFAPSETGVWAGYTERQLYEGLAETTLEHPIGAECGYSNLGVGLLGHVLTRITGESYDAGLKRHLLEPLGMKNTACRLSGEQRLLLATGYTGDELKKVADEDDFGCLAGCGDLASNVPDLARFLSLQMRAGQAGVRPVSGGTLKELHTPQRLMEDWKVAVGLGWIILPGSELDQNTGDVVWHNGGTEGFFSWMGFLPREKLGAIVLTNGFKPVDDVGLALLLMAHEQLKKPSVTGDALPSGEQVLDAYVEATGGAEAHDRIKSMTSRGKISLGGMNMSFEEYAAAPDRYYMRMDMGARTIVEQGSDGRTVWENVMLAAPEIKKGDERAMLLREGNLHQHSQWRKLYKQAECLKVTRFAEHDCYEVRVTPFQGSAETRYYDTQNALLVGCREEMEMEPFGKVEVETLYDDYRRIEGVLWPFEMKQTAGGINTHLHMDSAEVNVVIPDERFALPAKVRKLLDEAPASGPAARTQPAASRAQ